MSEFFWGALVGTGLPCLVFFLLLARGYRFSAKEISVFGAKFDAKLIDSLSPVQMFNSLSRIVMQPSLAADAWLEERGESLEPVMLIHLAWQVVSDAFIGRFAAYPSDKEIYDKAHEIGAQNAEFVANFRDVHEVSAKNPHLISLDIARAYFQRAPALYERLVGVQYQPDSLYLAANTFINSSQNRPD